MSFSSRRRNYLLTPHRRDGLIECMKGMLAHGFVLDALDATAPGTFEHFEQLIDEHRRLTDQLHNDLPRPCGPGVVTVPSRLQRLVPSVGTFHTRLPLRRAFEAYNAKYGVTRRRYICISFNEIRHILNLAQILAMVHPAAASDPSLEGADPTGHPRHAALEAWASMGDTPRTEGEDGEENGSGNDNGNDKDNNDSKMTGVTVPSSPELPPPSGKLERSGSCAIEHTLSLLPTTPSLPGPKLLCFDGDQTLYSDGANFEQSPELAKYLYLLLKQGVTIAVVTAAGYEYQAAKYELRLSGLLDYFQQRGLEEEELQRFYIFGGECNYLLRLGDDYRLHAVREDGPGGWVVATRHNSESPGNWSEAAVAAILDRSEACFRASLADQNLRARVIRKRRSVGLVPRTDEKIPREALDETVLRIQSELEGAALPFCAFNGGRDAWVDVGNKRVGVQVLQSYLGIVAELTLHIGDQFLNNGNDYAARSVCPCVWITSPEETTYILKSMLRLAGIPLIATVNNPSMSGETAAKGQREGKGIAKKVDFDVAEKRSSRVMMDVYTGEFIRKVPD